MTRSRSSTLEGIQENCYMDPNCGCWLWLGALSGTGYGRVWNQRAQNMVGVHRVAFILAGGEIPPGLQLDHICRVRSCCNPHHLRVMTCRENLLAPGSLSPTARHAAATHCPHGHPYSGDNLYNRPDRPGRQCRECQRAQARERQRAWTAEQRDRCNAYHRAWYAAREQEVRL